jgi:hypothetical protein
LQLPRQLSPGTLTALAASPAVAAAFAVGVVPEKFPYSPRLTLSEDAVGLRAQARSNDFDRYDLDCFWIA